MEKKSTLMKSKQDVVSVLNNLIETCKDGQQGYVTAANVIKNSDLKKLFKTFSRQRAQFVSELQAEVRRLGGNPEKSGSMAGAAHRGWIDVKALGGGDEESAVIAECEKGEDSAVQTYETAMAADLPEELQTLVKHQYLEIKESHNLISALEKATK